MFFMSIEKRINYLKRDIMAYMSQEGYDKLVADLQYLESVERPKASAAIAEAADKGDLSENSEYDAAKESQRHLEARIAEMKMTVAQAKIVETEANLKQNKISIKTPIAQGLLNKKVGDEVEITIPRGTIKLRIDKISIDV